MWLVIVQSDDLVDLLKDFTALFVISSVDDVFFIMASHGFLGRELSRAADATSITKIGRNPKNTGKVVSFLMPVTFVLCLSIMYGGWSYIVHERVSGRCVRQRYPICARNVVDISKLVDGPCNSEFDKIECGFDNGDCVTYNSMYPFCEVENPWWIQYFVV